MKIKTKRQHARLFPYTTGCLMAPIVIGSNNEFVGIALISACDSILLFYFDPVFKYYKSHLPKFDKYCKVSFALECSLLLFQIYYLAILVFCWLFGGFLFLSMGLYSVVKLICLCKSKANNLKRDKIKLAILFTPFICFSQLYFAP